MAVIYITEADKTLHKFRLPESPEDVVSIGRNENCLISLPGVIGLSGYHCSIALVGNEYIITDAGSSNGTLAGDRPITSEALCPGVVYGIGTATLTFEQEWDKPAPAAGTAGYGFTPIPAAAPEADNEYTPAPTPSRYAAPASAALANAAAAIGMGEQTPQAASLMEPIPVSEYAQPAPPAQESAPLPEYGEAEAYAEEAASYPAEESRPAPVKKKRKKPAFAAPLVTVQEESSGIANMVYVLVVLAVAFYIGMTLRHWMETGDFMPAFLEQSAE